MAKIRVIHFQRKPRPGFNFSIEYIFKNLRCFLKDKADFTIVYCKWFNTGYVSKVFNIVNAALQQNKSAVLHITGEVHFLNLLMRKKNVLLTIHDCRFMERKTGFQKKLMKWLYLKAPISKARCVTAVSENTKREIILYTKCNPDKISVIPVSVDNIYQPAAKVFNKSCPVILQIGAAANKNLERLTEALKDIECQLVIIGNPCSTVLDKLNAFHINYTIKSDLLQAELYREYINCDIVSFVSTYEGFGMPIIEANSVERAVITSTISSMPETAFDAACLVNPFYVDDIRNGIKKIIDDDEYRNQLIENGRKNKERFSAKYVADAYYAIYKKMSCNNFLNE